MAIYTFYGRRQNHMKLISSANRGRYIRLMIISSTEILGTIPLGTYYIVSAAKMGVVPWMGWAHMHSHASDVVQVPGFIWRNDPVESRNVELYRWSLVLCAFLFFALFGLAGEAREHYYRLYKSLAKLVGRSTSTAHGAQVTCVVRSPCRVCPGLTSRSIFFVFVLQYSTSTLYEEKRRRHKLYPGPNGPKEGQLEHHLHLTHRLGTIFD
jgi:hypothetical protein